MKNTKDFSSRLRRRVFLYFDPYFSIQWCNYLQYEKEKLIVKKNFHDKLNIFSKMTKKNFDDNCFFVALKDFCLLGFVYISDRLPTTSVGASSLTGWRTSSRAGAEAVNLLSSTKTSFSTTKTSFRQPKRRLTASAPARELVRQPVRELAPALVVGNQSLR